MKLQYRQIEGFIKNPDPAVDVILVYGPDDGLMRERAALMGKTVIDDLSDAFLVATLTLDDINNDPARFFDEAHAIPMMAPADGSGRSRLIRIRDGADALTATLKDYLEQPNEDALIIVEAGDLGPRSSLRKLCESAKNAAAVPCYVDDERSIRQVIQDTLRHAGYLADRDAVDFLSQAISGDRLKIRQDLDKLITYMGPDAEYKGLTGPAMTRQLGTVRLEDAQAACGAAGAQGVDDLVIAAGHCQGQRSVAILDTLLQEGTSTIWILRALTNHFRRLHEAKTKTSAGMTSDQAIDSLRPPVFFKQKPAFQKQLNSWSLTDLEDMLLTLTDMEVTAKSSGSKEETLIGQTLLRLSA